MNINEYRGNASLRVCYMLCMADLMKVLISWLCFELIKKEVILDRPDPIS